VPAKGCQMRAMAMTDYESGISLHELPKPEPAPNELLVRVRASSVNRIDVLVAGGALKGMLVYEFPVVPGRDFAGTGDGVDSDVSRFRVRVPAARAARVLPTARPGAAPRLRALGAAETIDYTQQDVADAVRERHRNGISALIDVVDEAEGFARLVELVREGGRAASSMQ